MVLIVIYMGFYGATVYTVPVYFGTCISIFHCDQRDHNNAIQEHTRKILSQESCVSTVTLSTEASTTTFKTTATLKKQQHTKQEQRQIGMKEPTGLNGPAGPDRIRNKDG